MKKLLGIFIIVLVSIGISDLIQGIILTALYTPKASLLGHQEISPIIKYLITATTLTLVLSFVYKIKHLFVAKKTMVNAS
ncbi:hypothetical protein [Sporosarcina sp. A2]|uniref:hypothetical protein n=1 Tax=Sporosarcina sp. A2 TaxID=3393449 RepID=UPI003D7A8275